MPNRAGDWLAQAVGHFGSYANGTWGVGSDLDLETVWLVDRG